MRGLKKQNNIFFKVCDRNYSDKYEMNSDNNVIERLIDYITDIRKTEAKYIGICSLYNFYTDDFSYMIAKQFYAVQILNRRFDIVGEDKLIHLIVSFPYDEILYCVENCMVFAQYIASYFGKKHQVIYAIHNNAIVYENRGPHIHFIINPVSFVSGEYLNINTTHFNDMINIIKQLIESNYRNIKITGYDSYLRYNY